jgi:hypothetical protein
MPKDEVALLRYKLGEIRYLLDSKNAEILQLQEALAEAREENGRLTAVLNFAEARINYLLGVAGYKAP